LSDGVVGVGRVVVVLALESNWKASELFSRPNYVAHFLQRRLSITLRFPRFPVPRFPPLSFGAGFSSSVFSSLAFSAPPFQHHDVPSVAHFHVLNFYHVIFWHPMKADHWLYTVVVGRIYKIWQHSPARCLVDGLMVMMMRSLKPHWHALALHINALVAAQLISYL